MGSTDTGRASANALLGLSSETAPYASLLPLRRQPGQHIVMVTIATAVLSVMLMGPVAGDRLYVIRLCGLLSEICEARYRGQLHHGHS